MMKNATENIPVFVDSVSKHNMLRFFYHGFSNIIGYTLL